MCVGGAWLPLTLTLALALALALASTLTLTREGVGTRLRGALEERMVDWASAAGQAVEARREARGEVALEPENDPATWPDARLVRRKSWLGLD